ncbi:MAG: hypothetical protein Q9217_001579 [Psora testacea]
MEDPCQGSWFLNIQECIVPLTLETLQDKGRQQHALKQLAAIPLNTSKTRLKPRPLSYNKDDVSEQPISGTQSEKFPARPLLERPYLHLSGRRHIPKLVNACRFPFLRIKKPQPAQLSRMIRDSIETRENRIRRSQELQTQIEIAKEEDEWDDILSRELGVSKIAGEGSWTTAPHDALGDIKQAHERVLKKRMEMAARMADIVEKEVALAAEEKRRRREIKHEKRKARLLERQSRDSPPAWEPSQRPNENEGLQVKPNPRESYGADSVRRPDRDTVLAERARRKEEKADAKEAKAKRKDEQAKLHEGRLAKEKANRGSEEDDKPPGQRCQSIPAHQGGGLPEAHN